MKTSRDWLLNLYLCNSQAQSGLTILELLVVMIIMGILSAIALPSFLNQALKARQTEAQTYIGIVNRAQQLHYMERSQFGELPQLEVGIPETTVNYTYTSIPDAGGLSVDTIATPDETVRGYRGRVWINHTVAGTSNTLSIMCEGEIGEVPSITVTNLCP